MARPDNTTIVKALKTCLDSDPEYFNSFEASFIESCAERAEQYRKVFYSEKQEKVLSNLWEKLEKR